MFPARTITDDSYALDRHPELWRWTPSPEQIAASREACGDVADEYVVVQVSNPATSSGVMVVARYGTAWQCNPWSQRPVIAELLRQLGTDVTAILPSPDKTP